MFLHNMLKCLRVIEHCFMASKAHCSITILCNINILSIILLRKPNKKGTTESLLGGKAQMIEQLHVICDI